MGRCAARLAGDGDYNAIVKNRRAQAAPLLTLITSLTARPRGMAMFEPAGR